MPVVAALLCSLAGCRTAPKLDRIILSYSEENENCLDCPKFQVEFREGGAVRYTCLKACAVPGEQGYVVPAERFRELVAAFQAARFFEIPRTDPSRIVLDAPILRLTYRDDKSIHQVVDNSRPLPRIKELEKRMRTATEVERYLTPSVALYRRLVASGWDVNTVGSDQQNALFAAAIHGDRPSVRFLLQSGSAVTGFTLEMAARDALMLRELLAASHVKPAGNPRVKMLMKGPSNPTRPPAP